MPSRSEAQRKMIFAKRNKYKAKEIRQLNGFGFGIWEI